MERDLPPSPVSPGVEGRAELIVLTRRCCHNLCRSLTRERVLAAVAGEQEHGKYLAA
jgi:hypothetical protein